MPLPESARIKRPRKQVAVYPPNHQAAMQVPLGGSSCATCEYLTDDEKNCSNRYFIRWNGSPKLPLPADQYCSDWYSPAEGTLEE